jgi:hypothetical protein
MVQIGIDDHNGKPKRWLVLCILGGWFALELAVITFVVLECLRVS